MSENIGSTKLKQITSDIVVNGSLFLLVFLWTIPTIGLLVSSFRTKFDIQTSGWWTILPHREWIQVAEIQIPDDLDKDGVMEIQGSTGTFQEFREGIENQDGKRVTWIGNKRLGRIEIQEQKWTMRTDFTLENYQQVLGGKEYEITKADGSIETVKQDDFWSAMFNSLTVSIPSTVIPMLIASFAAYGFAWIRFPGQKWLFVVLVALLVVPLQTALIPILRDYTKLDLNGTFLGLWLAHTGFGLSFATYLLYNFFSGLPRDLMESAFIDGASHFTIFTRLVIPLSVPALASFAIFQFLWVWNDYLVALVFVGAKPYAQVLTIRIAEMVGSRGSDWHVLTAGAFVSMLLPLLVFFSLQRFFVRGLLAGSIKG